VPERNLNAPTVRRTVPANHSLAIIGRKQPAYSAQLFQAEPDQSLVFR